MRRILYVSRVKKRGPLGIPYTAIVLRTAHMDERSWRRLRHRRFSIREMMLAPGLPD